MPDISVSRLASEVATLLGESLAPECHTEESPFPDLEDRVRILAPGLLADLLKVSPPENLSELSQMNSALTFDTNGDGLLQLPEDFLFLVKLKLNTWKRSATHITQKTNPVADLQGSSVAAIRGNSSRPVVMPDVNSAGKACLRLIPAAKGSVIESAIYVAVPGIDASGTLKVPPGLYHPLLMALVKEITS